jgi:hypothetical protein
MIELIDTMIAQGFAQARDGHLLDVVTSVNDIFAVLDRELLSGRKSLTGHM